MFVEMAGSGRPTRGILALSDRGGAAPTRTAGRRRGFGRAPFSGTV